MNISENQSRNLYAFFTVLFAINVGYTIWNFHESRKLRLIQKQIADEQLKQLKNGKNKENTTV
jgi:hypothetical protein